MKINPVFPYPLYLVISEKDCIHHHWLDIAEQAILGGVDIIQLREKDCTTKEYIAKATELKKITDHYSIPLIINDSLEVATTVNSWGIHVGRTDISPSEIINHPDSPKNIGWSLEVIEQLNENEMQFVHHLGVSPIFSTPTKTNTISEWGYEGLQNLKPETSKPLITIGGINENNIAKIVQAGADSVAIVSAICGSSNPKRSAQILKQIINHNEYNPKTI
ncbi:thiamine phosphate synthase [Faecalibacter rhinopitheci]|uniref:Thiamine-phosphate synthase n=1 Tax=Faecalibacter rhinopitheci TaxID=2779678 RepID=A0A8J7FRT6_9FLAO|nr:thiamine phosphate synthase [Faecalibacter rhinopitheci]MBF0597418.1 thiamine phosphate synthase [Faecalibacter rhinopitheci]